MDNLECNNTAIDIEVSASGVLNSANKNIKDKYINEVISQKKYQDNELNISDVVLNFDFVSPPKKRKKIKSKNDITEHDFNEEPSTSKTEMLSTFDLSENLVLNSKENDGSDKSKVKKSRPPPNRISAEMKKMIIDSLESGVLDRKSAATAFNLPYATVVTIYKKFLQTGAVGRKKKEEKIQEEQLQFILDTLAQNCTYTIKEITDMVKSKYDLEVHYVSVSKKIPAFHYNLNRIQGLTSSNISEETIKNHKEYCNIIFDLQNSNRKIIYVDETEFKVLMRRFCGRVDPVQKTGQSTAPSLRTRHRTIMVSLTKNRLIFYRALEDPRTRSDLVKYMTDLISMLKRSRITDAVLVLGNSLSRDCDLIRDLVEAEGHQLVLQPAHSSEWFSPVEFLFSQWATIVRAQSPETEAHLEVVMATFGGLISGPQCEQYVRRATDNVRDCLAGQLVYQ